ncbi:MAG: cupin domain-containing protein [Rhizobiales bacterium]|nr:cupin domain-containing protein [Hyphomicrobiales bacterium]
MAKIDIARIPADSSTIYTGEFRNVVAGREKQKLGDAVGLTQFGVNITRLKPGSSSSLRHWHAAEDEFIYMLEGELVLVEDGGETPLKAGDAAGFKAGVANGHHLVNRSGRDARYLEIGTRAPRERATYSDVDLVLERDAQGPRFFRRSGEPYSPARSG